MDSSSLRVGIAAAGSGGHVYPAIAVADALVAAGVDPDAIVFFGGDRMEATTVPDAGYRFVGLDIHGFKRTITTSNIKLPLKVRAASKRVAEEISEAGLSVMVVFGGYVSGPAAQAARKRGIPVVVHEANAVPGLANRLVAGRADVVLLGFEAAKGKLASGRVVGNPLRSTFDTFDRDGMVARARARYAVDSDKPVLGIVGGSLGAAALNEIAASIATRTDRTFSVLHLSGPANHEAVAAVAAGVDGWNVLPFEDDMATFYAACDLVVSRAGALTIAELTETATPAIVVPLPAGRGYQAENAAELVANQGAILLDQEFPDAIVDTAFALMGDEVRRKAMASAAEATGHRHAAATVAASVIEVANG